MRGDHPLRIGITSGLRGIYAVLYEAKTGEAISTGIGSYRTNEECAAEAYEWSVAEGVPLEDWVKEIADRQR